MGGEVEKYLASWPLLDIFFRQPISRKSDRWPAWIESFAE
jgi:hypothetical protein